MKRLIIIVIALLLAWIVPADTARADPGWDYYSPITLESDMVGITSDLSSSASSGQKDVVVKDGSLFAATESVVIRDDSASETNTISSVSSNTLTMNTNLANTYTTAANAFVKNTTDSTNLSNFPVLISLTDNRLKYAASGDPEHVRQADGGDFVFTDNSNTIVYVLIIALAETVTGYISHTAGLLMHCTTMFALFVHAALIRPSHKEMSSLLMATGFTPLIRIVSLSAPLAPFGYIAWFLIVSLPLFVGVLVLARLQGLRERDLGLTFNPSMFRWELAVVLIGLPTGIFEYLLLRPSPLIYDLSVSTLLGPALIMLIGTGFIEELIFRGLIQHHATRLFGPAIGILISALLFSFLHIGNLSLVSMIFAFSVGVVYSFLVRRTGSILGVSLAHGLSNCMLFLVMPLYL